MELKEGPLDAYFLLLWFREVGHMRGSETAEARAPGPLCSSACLQLRYDLQEEKIMQEQIEFSDWSEEVAWPVLSHQPHPPPSITNLPSYLK